MILSAGMAELKPWPHWAEPLLEWLHEGKSLLAFCRVEGNPSNRTCYDLRRDDTFYRVLFDHARENGAAMWIDKAQEVADDGSNDTYTDEHGRKRVDHDNVHRSKLRVDTLFKRAACFCPRLYGTKVALGGDGGQPIRVEQNRGDAVKELASILATAARRIEGVED